MKHWWREAVFYHIYPLGFCGVKDLKPDSPIPRNNLTKIEGWLDHIVELGFDALYLGPVFASSSHGYDTADWYHIDRRLGRNEDFAELCGRIKSRGIRIVLDGVFHHVGREFWAFQDVLKNGEASPFCSWFSGLSFEGQSPLGDPFVYDCWEGHTELVKLNLQNRDLVQHIFGAIESWLKDYHIDGLRLDVAYALEPDFLRQLADFCADQQEDFFLLGEVIHGDYGKWATAGKIHSVTNYECFKGIYSAHNDRNLFEIAHSLERQAGPEGVYRGLPLYNFLDNHDVNRIASLLEQPAWIHTAYILLLTIPGIPSIYYGSEWGIQGERSPHSDGELRPSRKELEGLGPKGDVEGTVRRVIRIRRETKALLWGDYRGLIIESEQMAFSRSYQGEEVIVALNIDDSPRHLSIPMEGGGSESPKGFIDLLNPGEEFRSHGGSLELDLHPRWGRILFSGNH